jgi:hypothetical protein
MRCGATCSLFYRAAARAGIIRIVIMSRMKQILGRVPLVKALYSAYSRRAFTDSPDYWEHRYQRGGNSGAGSYGRLAQFKAEVLNGLIREHRIQSAIEFGCGDGNQLSLLEVPAYIGLDVSRTILEQCIDRFRSDASRSFFLFEPRAFLDRRRLFSADLSMSIDVIYHLVEDEIFHAYMQALCHAADRFVVIYSSNEEQGQTAAHVRHRCFTDWIAKHAPGWALKQKIDNRYPFDPRSPDETSDAGFYLYERSAGPAVES